MFYFSHNYCSQPMDIHHKLSDVGLSERWLSVFKNHLGIETPQGLEYTGMESYPLLVQFVNDPQEKIALRKLLNKQTDHTKKKHKRLIELIKELKQLKESGKHRQDCNVRFIEMCCREMFQVSENEWIKKEVSFSDMIKKLEQMMGSIETAFQGEDLNEGDFVAHVSGGLLGTIGKGYCSKGSMDYK